jgi:hypothetical protein
MRIIVDVVALLLMWLLVTECAALFNTILQGEGDSSYTLTTNIRGQVEGGYDSTDYRCSPPPPPPILRPEHTPV